MPGGGPVVVRQRAVTVSVRCEMTLHTQGGSLSGIACSFDDGEPGLGPSRALRHNAPMTAHRWQLAFLIATLAHAAPGAAPQPPSERISRALDAVMDVADRGRLRSFVVAISDADQLVVESWPRPLGARPARFGLLGNTEIVNRLLLRRLRQHANPDLCKTIVAAVTTASGDGVSAQQVTFELDDLVAGKVALAPFRGAVAREICESGAALEPYLIGTNDYWLKSGGSVLPSTLLRRALERASSRRWADLVVELLGAPGPATAGTVNAERFLGECADASTRLVEFESARLEQSGVAHFDSLHVDRRQAAVLLEQLRAVAAETPDAEQRVRLGMIPYSRAEFVHALDTRGAQASYVAVRNDGGSAFLLYALADHGTAQLLGETLEEALRSKPLAPERDQWSSAIGLGGGGGKPAEPPAWSKLSYAGELLIAGTSLPVELQIDGETLALRLGTEPEQPRIRTFRVAHKGLSITMDGSATWLPDRHRLGFEREAICVVSLELEDAALVGAAMLIDDPDPRRAANCVPAAVRLVPRR